MQVVRCGDVAHRAQHVVPHISILNQAGPAYLPNAGNRRGMGSHASCLSSKDVLCEVQLPSASGDICEQHQCSVSEFIPETLNGFSDTDFNDNNSVMPFEVEPRTSPQLIHTENKILPAQDPIPIRPVSTDQPTPHSKRNYTEFYCYERPRTCDGASGPRSYMGTSRRYVAGPQSVVPRRRRSASERPCSGAVIKIVPARARIELQRANWLLTGSRYDEPSECACCAERRYALRSASCQNYTGRSCYSQRSRVYVHSSELHIPQFPAIFT